MDGQPENVIILYIPSFSYGFLIRISRWFTPGTNDFYQYKMTQAAIYMQLITMTNVAHILMIIKLNKSLTLQNAYVTTDFV